MKIKGMYYRRKLLLAVIERAGGKIGKLNLHKALFLIKNDSSYYDFVPYKYGCFSFQAANDLRILAGHYRIIEEDKKSFALVEKCDFLPEIKEEDLTRLDSVFENYPIKSTSQIINAVYSEYPYYTLFSTRKMNENQKVKQREEKEKIERQEDESLLTIGYEGISIDAYLNKLIKSNTRVLCDVRRNPVSMKFGFSKGQLSVYCENVGIEYCQIPELGIESDKRQKLNTKDDYRKLFKGYSRCLSHREDSMGKLDNLINEYGRGTLTCFEKDPAFCHRSILADYYAKNIANRNVQHL